MKNMSPRNLMVAIWVSKVSAMVWLVVFALNLDGWLSVVAWVGAAWMPVTLAWAVARMRRGQREMAAAATAYVTTMTAEMRKTAQSADISDDIRGNVLAALTVIDETAGKGLTERARQAGG